MEPGGKASESDEMDPRDMVLKSEMDIMEPLVPPATDVQPGDKVFNSKMDSPMSLAPPTIGVTTGGIVLNSKMDISESLVPPADVPPGEMYVHSSEPSSEVPSRLHSAISSETFCKIQQLTNHGSSKTVQLKIPNNASATLSQTTSTLHDQTPPIPIATPILITTSDIQSTIATSTRNILNSLFTCTTSLDPLLLISSVREELYGLPSMVQRLVMEKRLKEHQGCVNCINFSWQGDLLASSSDDLHVVLWDWRKGRVASKFDSGHVANVFQAKFMPHCDDSVLVTASRDGQVRCHALTSTGQPHHSRTVGNHNDSAHKLSIEPDSPHVLLSSGEDGTVLQIDLREDNKRNKVLVCKNEKNKKIPLYSISIDPSDKNYFAVSGQNQFARIYDRRLLRQAREDLNRKYDPVKTYCPDHLVSPSNEMRRANITCLVYSYNGKQLLCSYNDEDIYLFDTTHSSGANYIRKYSGHRNSATVKGVNFFGLKSEYVVSGSDCGNVFLWDTDKENIVQYMDGDFEGVVNCLEPHPHVPILATSGLDHDVKIFSPMAARPTTLDGLDQVVEQNKARREEAWSSSSSNDGFSIFAELLLRHYRRGLRERAGLEAEEDSDDSFLETPPSGREDGEGEDDDEEGDEGDEEGRRRLRRCIQQ